jgi:hypothetical protein
LLGLRNLDITAQHELKLFELFHLPFTLNPELGHLSAKGTFSYSSQNTFSFQGFDALPKPLLIKDLFVLPPMLSLHIQTRGKHEFSACWPSGPRGDITGYVQGMLQGMLKGILQAML